MKRHFASILLAFFLATLTAFSDTSNWFEYNGSSENHSFSFYFPKNWTAKTYDDQLQGFSPNTIYDDLIFEVQEFENFTYDQAIQTYLDADIELISQEDIALTTSDDIIGKKVTFYDKVDEKEFSLTFTKRGSLILSLTNPNPNDSTYNDEIQQIHDSIKFTDEWHQYIDSIDQYTFIFPKNAQIQTLSNGIAVVDPDSDNTPFFTIEKLDQTYLSEAPEKFSGSNLTLISTEGAPFHGIENAVLAVYLNEAANKTESYIFVENNGSSYAITNISNEEMLLSFEFFDLTGEFSPYKHFPDVRDNHINSPAINYLFEKKIINGYPDGQFKPDNEINRAELTKMMVGATLTPSVGKYSDCFPDVKEEWFAPYICYAKQQGWVQGYSDGTFKPEQNINRMEALKIILEGSFENITTETLKPALPADIDLSKWYSRYFIFAENRNLLDKNHILQKGDTYYYYPDKNITRKEVAEMIYRILVLE
ncbi:MAG: S-layer homology domain-containing protein [Candidatus Peregrinibacteria bacterium]